MSPPSDNRSERSRIRRGPISRRNPPSTRRPRRGASSPEFARRMKERFRAKLPRRTQCDEMSINMIDNDWILTPGSEPVKRGGSITWAGTTAARRD